MTCPFLGWAFLGEEREVGGYGTLWSELNFNSNFIQEPLYSFFFPNKMAPFFRSFACTPPAESIMNLVLKQTRHFFALNFMKGGLHIDQAAGLIFITRPKISFLADGNVI